MSTEPDRHLTINERARRYVARVLTEPRSDELLDRIADVIRPVLGATAPSTEDDRG